MRLVANIFCVLLLIIFFFEIMMMAPRTIDEEERGQAPGNILQDKNSGEAHLLEGIHLVESSEGRKEWELWADKAIGSQGAKGDWLLDVVKVYFYSDDGSLFEVVGKKGRIIAATKNMEISGNVITRASNGYQMLAPSIIYDSGQRALLSEAKVLMVGPKIDNVRREKVNGSQMKARIADQMISFDSEVKAETKTAERLVHVKSNKAEFSGLAKMTRFFDNVTIDVEQIRISGIEAVFKYGKSGRDVESVLVTGGVKVSDLEKWAVAERVDVKLKDNKFVFNGSPRVVQDKDELRGEEIVFLDGGKRVEVVGARAKLDESKTEKSN